MDAVGDQVGTPTIHTSTAWRSSARCCHGSRAARRPALWDASVALASYPHAWELKRTRTEAPAYD